VFDEIQCGFGRTGRLWAAEHAGVVPDLMTVGKGIGGGMPVSAVVGRPDVMRHWPAGTHTSTFMGNAVNLAAGHAAIEVMRRDRLWERSERLGAELIKSLHADLAGSPPVGEVRGVGLFIGIEIVTDAESRTPDPALANRIRRAAFDRGVLVGIAGHAESVLKICPPLTIEEPLLETAAGILVDSIKGAR
jgi:4-aminobutyrate aminotransferase-like enzyme